MGERAVPVRPDTLEEAARLLGGRRVAVLTGAGCSTASGIPDYRGPTSRKRNPIQYREFVRDAGARRRYWARSVIGWPVVAAAAPNPAHRALAELERAGAVSGVITQNVDRLHRAAGSREVIELHGALAEVVCLDCGALESRDELQRRLVALNPGWRERRAEHAPDGDAELAPEVVASFRVAGCAGCGGVLKPNVVFFGENVPRAVVDDAWRTLDRAEALLVVGSSLTVFSGFRFVRRAAGRGQPVAIVNLGPTRGDPLADCRVESEAGAALSHLVTALAAARARPDAASS